MKKIKLFFFLLVSPFFLVTSSAQEAIFGAEQIFYKNLVTQPESVFAADLDGDGDQDVLYTSLGVDEIGWFVNDGSGQFGDKQVITTSVINSREVYACDLDGDGDQDVLSASYDDDKIAWYENDGMGNFSSQQIISSTLNKAELVMAADLDGDGDLDVLAGSSASPSGQTIWYENDGAGNFINEEVITNATQKLEDLAIADLDNDGDLDIISGSYYDDKIAWYENNGTGVFGTQQILTTLADGVKSICVADLDNDGDLDIVSASSKGNKIEYLENNGGAAFGAIQTLSGYKNGVLKVLAEDLDNDGDVDVLYGSSNQERIGWIENNGNFPFTNQSNYYNILGVKDLFLSDLDGDGISEILQTTYHTSSSNQLLWMDTSIPNNNSTNYRIGISKFFPEKLFTEDMDNDGDLDVIINCENKFVWYENMGNNLMEEAFVIDYITCPYSYSYKETHIADLNGDGYPDVLHKSCGNPLTSAWYENDGTGGFTEHNIPLDLGRGMDLADMDGDGDLDIISVDITDILLYKNNGLGVFDSPIVIFSALNYSYYENDALSTVDIDNDNDMDVLYVVCDYDGWSCNYNLYWLENLGGGSMGASNFLASDFFDSHINFGDINNDGNIDILQETRRNIYWYENNNPNASLVHPLLNGSLYFNENVYIEENCLADIEGDGDLDIIFPLYAYNSNSYDNFAYYLNEGSGNFSTNFDEIPNSERELAFAAADINNDGDVAILAANSYGFKIYEFEGFEKKLYVDVSAVGNNDGTNWTNAFTDLQDALAIAEPEGSIHIAEGTYYPTSLGVAGARGISFDITDSLTILGGYPTGGGIRDPNIHETILSGNVDNDASIQGDSYHVLTINNAINVKIDGITIREGNADNPNSYARSRGGGVYLNNSTVEFNDVDFKWNRGIKGGALFAKFSDVTFNESSFKKNRADYGAAMYYSNASNINLLRSEVVQNTSNNRCAIESNNALNTTIENSLIANNASANANALGVIATNRDATVQILNSTILGETKDKNLITYQVGNNDQLDVTINNSIMAHQNPNFDKNMIAYNNNILNLNHSNCYFSGSSTIGNGTNSLYADTAGDLLLNADYTLDECSPAINAGNDALGTTGALDYFGNPRYFNTIDIGAYEAQVSCANPRESMSQYLGELNISLFPNPAIDESILRIEGEQEELHVRIYDALAREIYQGEIENELTVNTKDWQAGIYYVVLMDISGRIKGNHKFLVQK